MSELDVQLTATTKARYNRLASVYNLMELFVEHFALKNWRERLWAEVQGERVLEVGVGTGKNMPFYPPGVHMTAIDLSDGMLAQARKRAQRENIEIELREMDAQALDFPDDTFDTAVATFVFCSVPDPILGLQELARVVKPGGRILLLEHMRAESPILGGIMDFLNPFVVRITGGNINRRTVENVRRAGLQTERVERLSLSGIVKLIAARGF